jgi:hypothetical protein
MKGHEMNDRSLRRTRFIVRSGAIGIVLGLILGTAATFGSHTDSAASTIAVTSITTMAADDQTAAAILGQPAPQPRLVPDGFARTQLTVDPDTRPVGPRFVHQTFGVGGHNVARLDAYRGDIGRVDGDPLTIGGKQMSVSTKKVSDGSVFVNYAWNQNGLALVLHVNLVFGMNREIADALAASTR